MNGNLLALGAVSALALGASARRGSRSSLWDGYSTHVDLRLLEPMTRHSGDRPGILEHVPPWGSPELREAFRAVSEQRAEAGWPKEHIPRAVPGPDEEARYRAFLREISGLSDPVRIYRMVSALRVEDVEIRPDPAWPHRGGTGIYWSWDVKRASTYNSGDHHPEFLIVADTPATSVDWALTAQANVEWPEREITLRWNAPLRVLRIRDVKTGLVARQGPMDGQA